jgi:hypothetical protein
VLSIKKIITVLSLKGYVIEYIFEDIFFRKKEAMTHSYKEKYNLLRQGTVLFISGRCLSK